MATKTTKKRVSLVLSKEEQTMILDALDILDPDTAARDKFRQKLWDKVNLAPQTESVGTNG